VEVKTRYKPRRIVAVERIGAYVLIKYESGEVDKLHLQAFAARRFVATL